MNTPLVECYALHTKFLTGSDAAQFAAQFDEFLAFLSVQRSRIRWQPGGSSTTGLAYPAQDAGDVAAEFF
jgi:hypothetical protein